MQGKLLCGEWAGAEEVSVYPVDELTSDVSGLNSRAQSLDRQCS